MFTLAFDGCRRFAPGAQWASTHPKQPQATQKSTQDTTQQKTRQDNTTQHNTTQHSTAQHSTAQHHTTQHNTTLITYFITFLITQVILFKILNVNTLNVFKYIRQFYVQGYGLLKKKVKYVLVKSPAISGENKRNT